MESSFFNPVAISFLEPGDWKAKVLEVSASGAPMLFIYSKSAMRAADSDGSFIGALHNQSKVKLLTDIESNPSVRQFVRIRKELGQLPNTVFAMGGGSVIDVAKILKGLASGNLEMGEAAALEMVGTKRYLKLASSPIRLIALPSTAGTGSELTKWATIWDMQDKKKYSVEREDMYPFEAWIDPQLSAGMTKGITVSTGLDAMCQAIEAYWSTKSNPIVRRLSARAITEVVQHLEHAADHPEDLEARGGMCLGSVFAGLAFSQTRTTACHALSYPLTARFGIPHGIAVCMSLLHIMRLNWECIEEKELFLSAFGCRDKMELEAALERLLGMYVYPVVKALGPIKNLSAIISEDIGSMGARLGNNPVDLSSEKIMDIYYRIFKIE